MWTRIEGDMEVMLRGDSSTQDEKSKTKRISHRDDARALLRPNSLYVIPSIKRMH
jgi:hypothetical protein